MHDLVFYLVEYAAILLGVVSIHKCVFNRGRGYDQGSLYLSVLAATFLWVFTASIHFLGLGAGIAGGLVAGGVAVIMLDKAVGFLHDAGY